MAAETAAQKTTPDGRFSYREAGDPRGPALVFLHGIGGQAEIWRPQLEAFPAWRRIAWDMPGYEGSAPLSDVTIATLAEALERFLAQVGAAQPVLVGHSIGGMIVQEFFARYPEGGRAAVLAQTSAAFGQPDGEWQREFIAERFGPLDAGETLASLAQEFVEGLVGDDPDPEGMVLARRCMAAVPEDSYRAMMRALLGFDRREALARLRVPTLLVAGSRDESAPASVMARMAGRIPGAEYVCLDGVGHLVGVERPQQFNRVLEDFLATLPDGRA